MAPRLISFPPPSPPPPSPLRDLKAANVLLDEDGSAVVGDFGVARLKGERGEMTKEVGTYRWMAPEAFGTASWAVTHRSDVYSFGIVLWELLTARLPYDDYSPLQAAVAVALNGLRPSIPEDCPADLAALIQRCWHKDPGERLEFTEIIETLERMERGEGEKGKGREGEGGGEAMEGVEGGESGGDRMEVDG